MMTLGFTVELVDVLQNLPACLLHMGETGVIRNKNILYADISRTLVPKLLFSDQNGIYTTNNIDNLLALRRDQGQRKLHLLLAQ